VKFLPGGNGKTAVNSAQEPHPSSDLFDSDVPF
jgi:hypothetical protein